MFNKLSILFLAVILIGYGYYHYKSRRKKLEKAVKIPARIVKIETLENNYIKYIYEYTIHGKKYKSSLNSYIFKEGLQKKENIIGKKKMIYCNPDKPLEIFAETDYLSYPCMIGGVIIILFDIFFI